MPFTGYPANVIHSGGAGIDFFNLLCRHVQVIKGGYYLLW
jgi:hypothetical protein